MACCEQSCKAERHKGHKGENTQVGVGAGTIGVPPLPTYGPGVLFLKGLAAGRRGSQILAGEGESGFWIPKGETSYNFLREEGGELRGKTENFLNGRQKRGNFCCFGQN